MATLIAHIKPRDWNCPSCKETVMWQDDECACSAARPASALVYPTVEECMPYSIPLRVNDIQDVREDGFSWGEGELDNYTVWYIAGTKKDWCWLADGVYEEGTDEEGEPYKTKLSKRRCFIDQASALADAEKSLVALRTPVLCAHKRERCLHSEALHDYQASTGDDRITKLAAVETHTAELVRLDGELVKHRLTPIPLNVAHVYDRTTRKAISRAIR